MASHHPSDVDSGVSDSVTSSPRSDYPPPAPPVVRFMCSVGGRIVPRPHDNQLRYVGGDTRIVSVPRSTNFSALLTKLSTLSGFSNITVKYQLPNEDLDALISVTTDEDVDNMMEEFDRLTNGINSKTARLRLFLFPERSLGSLLNGSSKREHWFFDALKGSTGRGPGSLDQARSEASSIVSEVPDYLFGLDNLDENREPKPNNVLLSEPGSPAPITSSEACVLSVPDLPPVKTRPESQATPLWQFLPPGSQSHFSGPAMQNVPVYFVPAPVQPFPLPGPYVHRFPPPPVGFRHPLPGQVYGGIMNPVTAVETFELPAGVSSDTVSRQVYYAVRNPGIVSTNPSNVELQ